ncbi:MAG TPA: helix-turn-helix transcriptional regulator [Armatimonadota bacterium]|nr:helix-turn-helix transcriptional regulator [Armatimonadota bacterium]
MAGWFAETPPAHPRVPQVVPQVEQFMLQHLAEPITMATLAQHAGYCPRHLARLFRAQTGLSPMAYLLQLRMRQVCLLLRETDLKLSAIGARVGIANVAYFCALFKRRFGMTPSQYRTDVGA